MVSEKRNPWRSAQLTTTLMAASDDATRKGGITRHVDGKVINVQGALNNKRECRDNSVECQWKAQDTQPVALWGLPLAVERDGKG